MEKLCFGPEMSYVSVPSSSTSLVITMHMHAYACITGQGRITIEQSQNSLTKFKNVSRT
jgi:hypothetical protein